MKKTIIISALALFSSAIFAQKKTKKQVEQWNTLWDKYGKEISPKTTVILLGDARNNYHASQAWVIKEIRRKARHVYWLNPEPKSYWNTGDSILNEYAAHVDGTFECRNLRQLERFVEQLA